MKSSNISQKKSLGQNFLINQGILDKIIDASEINEEDIILEIGPGTGNLTEKLSETLRQSSGQEAGRVIAIEKDRRLITELQEKFKTTNVELIEGDVLNLKIENLNLKDEEYKIVANIPYYITSHLIKIIFEKWPRPKLIVLTIQKEVARRIMAKPPRMNLLALSVQFFSNPKIIGYVSKGSFRPIPKVDSAIIRLIPKSEKPKNEQKDLFFKLTRAGFSEKRKLLITNIAREFVMMKEDLFKAFDKIGIQQNARAENLSLNQWVELAKYMQK